MAKYDVTIAIDGVARTHRVEAASADEAMASARSIVARVGRLRAGAPREAGMRAWWGIRRLRRWWLRYRILRWLEECRVRDLGPTVHPAALDYLEAVRRGEG